jgi:integrase/recombinase XerD
MKMTDFEFQLENFMLYCSSKNLSKKTMKAYEQTLKLFGSYMQEKFAVEEVEKVQTGHIRQYIKYLRERGKYTTTSNQKSIEINKPHNRKDYKKEISDATINNYIRNIKVFFNWLYEENEIRKNPVEKIQKIKTERKMKETISEEEFKALLRSFDTTKLHGYRNQIIAKLLLDTGMRIGECLTLTIENIDIKNKVILVENTKGKNQRYVYFSIRMGDSLRRWLQYKDRYIETEFLFPTNKGTQLTINAYETQLKKAGEKIGIKIHPHQLRNNFAKYYLLNGGDFFTLSKILGHSSVSVTEQAYMDLTTEEINKKYQKHSPLNNWRL